MSEVKTQSKLKKNLWLLIILATSGSIIYSLPFFRFYYYDAFAATFHLSNKQIGTFGSIYGIFGMISYLFGGILADRISARKLISFSLVTTGLCGFVHLLRPTYAVLLCIYAVWGVTSLLTFWPALLKGIRMLANPEEQGKAFGLFEGGRGVVNAVHLALALAVFGYISKSINDSAGINAVIILYSSLTILFGIATFFILKDNEKEVSDKFEWANIGKVLKMPSVWMITAILCCSYTMNMSFYYFTPYATAVFGTTAILAAILTILAQYCRPFASAGAGFLGDKLGSSNILMAGFALMAIGTIGIIFVPNSGKMIPILIICCVIIYIAMFMNYGLIFSLLEEGDVPLEVSGTAIGFISTVGYIPEFICPYVAGSVLDKYPGAQGYRIYFTGLVVFAVIGFIITLVWKKITVKKKCRKVIMKETEAKAEA